MKYQKVFILLIFSLLLSVNTLFAQKDSTLSFRYQSKTARYYSFSVGMGLNYCDNKSLKTFVEYELPFYNNVSVNQKISSFFVGIEFFGGAELQLSKKLALKGSYSYFSKTMNSSLPQYQNYNFTYYSHQPYLTLYYLIPQEYSFIKVGTGVGFLTSKFTNYYYGTMTDYSSIGLGFKIEGVLNMQISKSFTGYLGCYINKTFQSDLKDSGGNLLLNRNNETVNLNSFGLGVRLGVEFYFFKI
jgi:hypothetical protein